MINHIILLSEILHHSHEILIPLVWICLSKMFKFFSCSSKEAIIIAVNHMVIATVSSERGRVHFSWLKDKERGTNPQERCKRPNKA